MEVTKGRCLCGQVTFEFTGSPLWCGHCHCDSCRRATASPFTTWIGVPRNACRFTGVAPLVRPSSPGARRSFCPSCGSPTSFESTRWPDETHLYAALLDNPADAKPQFHVHVAEKLPWIKLADDLPQYQRSSS